MNKLEKLYYKNVVFSILSLKLKLKKNTIKPLKIVFFFNNGYLLYNLIRFIIKLKQIIYIIIRYIRVITNIMV